MAGRGIPRNRWRVPQGTFQENFFEDEVSIDFEHFPLAYAQRIAMNTYQSDNYYSPTTTQDNAYNGYFLNSGLTSAQVTTTTGASYSAMSMQTQTPGSYYLLPNLPSHGAISGQYWLNPVILPTYVTMEEPINSYNMWNMVNPMNELFGRRELERPNNSSEKQEVDESPLNGRMYRSEEGYLVEEPPTDDSKENSENLQN